MTEECETDSIFYTVWVHTEFYFAVLDCHPFAQEFLFWCYCNKRLLKKSKIKYVDLI